MRKLADGTMRGLVAMATMALTLSCDGAPSGTDGCTPIDPSVCADPTECISVRATWCPPGVQVCNTSDVNLSLVHPDGIIVIGVGNGEVEDANGCVHEGDEIADQPFDRNGDGQAGPFEESITCSPFTFLTPPDRVETGLYVIRVDDQNAFFDTGDIRVEILVDGVDTCQFVNVDDDGQIDIDLNYP